MKTRIGFGLLVAAAIGCADSGPAPQQTTSVPKTSSTASTNAKTTDGTKLTQVTLKLPGMT